jgi:tetratricopeptide (TPR) repeat protein
MGALVLLVLVASAGRAGAGIHPEVARPVAALEGAPAYDAYARLRELWQAWEITDPVEVEEALAAVAESERIDPAVRVYAGVLEAYARRRRGDLAGARRRVDALGYVGSWLVVGPFDNENKTGLAEKQVPEIELGEPVTLDRTFSGKERVVRWRRAPDVHRWGYLDLGAMLRPERDICAFATTYVKSSDPHVTLWVGVTGAFRLYLDERQVLEDAGYRQLDPDRRGVKVELHDGFNRVTVKVCGDETPPAVSLRVGAPDGGVARGVEISVAESASTDAAQRMRATPAPSALPPSAPRKADRAAKPKGGAKAGLLGPLDVLEARLKRSPDDAAVLESYARYLMLTGGEAEASHEARDAARRAAERQPTVARALLAAALAEDRNRQREHVTQAQGLARQPIDRAAVLHARARLERSGPNWREAFPLYAELLRLEPQSVAAILGQVDLYLEAGLKRTALAALEKAARAQPASVAILRTLGAQLRAAQRDTEAVEVEARYAALRFDDGGWLGDQLAFAVARRDALAVERWAERLLLAEPASLWAHAVVARARRAMGQTDRAVQTYERALVIAPEDLDTLRALSELHGSSGRRDQQVALLRRILRLSPQSKDVRAYLEHMRPSGARADEAYAWPPERFLALRSQPGGRHARRTLRQLTVTTVFDNGLASQFKQLVFQPLDEEAAAEGRQFGFVYHSDRQIVQLRAARVFRLNGRVDEAIESGEAPLNDPSINMYTLQRSFIVRFPRLEPGDVVELSYRIEDVAPRNELGSSFGEIEYLQSDEPIANAEYVLITPKDKRIDLSLGPRQLKGIAQSDVVKGKRRIRRIVARNVAPLTLEARMPRPAELLAHVHASTFASWKDVGAFYWRLARDKLDVDEDVRALAKRLVAGRSSDRDKVAAIYHFAASEIRYVALELGIEGIRPRAAALTLARGWGDCKDKATLIIALLREVGIAAEYVLVRTGLRGKFDPTTPSLAPFDHAIAYVPSLDLYLDGTAAGTGMGELPLLDRSAMGLRISGGEGKLVTLPDPAPSASRERRSVELSLSADGRLRFNASFENQGVDAPAWRQRYQSESTRRERVSSDLASVLGQVELTTGARGVKVSDLDDVERAVLIEASGSAEATREGALLSLPMGPRWTLVSQLAARPGRRHDVLVGALKQHEESWTLRLPAGLKVRSVPAAAAVNSPFGRFLLRVERAADTITVESQLTIDKSRIAPRDYAAFRRFCEEVDAAAAPRVVLEKSH